MLLLRSSALFTRSSRGWPKAINGDLELAKAVGAWRKDLCRSSRIRVSGLLLQQGGRTPTRAVTRCYSSSSFPISSSVASLASSCFSPSLSSLVDLSEYLVNGCNWREAPKCPDYIGPLSIARTPDGRGRGLYASHDVAAGDILIISNAFAASYNDSHSIDLYTKIATIVKESPKALRQFYSLAGYDYHDDMEVPHVKLFDPNIPYTDRDPPANLEFDEKRIMHIMNVNSFEGELTSLNSQPETRLTGLWLLPSFINHSCSPNASRLVVGEAMFILASRDIQAKEEIMISYTDSLSPLKRREDNLASMGYGFRCQCKRCVAERSVQQELQDISQRYHELYDKAVDEVYSAVTAEVRPSGGKFPVCMELSGLYDSLTKKVSSLNNLTKLQRQWILGGYSSAFLGKWLVTGYCNGFVPPSNFVNSTALELVEAMKSTVPGMLRTLSFTTILATVAEKEEGQFFALAHSLVRLSLDECVRVYGKQRLDVTVKLMEQSVDIVPFFLVNWFE